MKPGDQNVIYGECSVSARHWLEVGSFWHDWHRIRSHMGNGNFSIGTIRGIRILINWTWIGIFVLVTWSLAGGYFPSHFKHWSSGEYWLVAAAAALLLFVSVLIHELSHSTVAQSRGLPVSTITLYIFGGVSNLTRGPSSPGEEFWIAAAGPLSSIAIGALCIGLHAVIDNPDWLGAILGYLGAVNLILALFNMIPAFPLDGGRVFRSIVWGIMGDLKRATRLATRISQGIAWVFILIGVWQMFVGNFIGGLWLAFIGWFLSNAATATYKYAQQSAEFQNVDVDDVMRRNVVTTDPEATLDSVVHGHLLQQGTRAVPVIDDGQLVGLLTVSDIRYFPPDQWPVIKVWRAMTAVAKLDSVTPNTALMDAIDLMNQHGHNQLPVTENGSLEGLLSRADVLKFLQVRQELGLDKSATASPSSPTET